MAFSAILQDDTVLSCFETCVGTAERKDNLAFLYDLHASQTFLLVETPRKSDRFNCQRSRCRTEGGCS